MEGSKTDKPLGDMVFELFRRQLQLVRQEIELAKAEMSMTAAKAFKYFIIAVAGGGMAFASLAVLLQGIAVALSEYLPPLISSIIVSVFAGNLGLIIAGVGIYKLSKGDFTPHRTREVIEEQVLRIGEEAS